MTQHLLVGCGKMGGALLAGWLARGVAPETIHVVEPAPVHTAPGVRVVDRPEGLAQGMAPDIVIFAVKPQSLADVARHYRKFATGAVFLSIAAGKPLAFFEGALGDHAAIVRSMPNTPAAVGAGVTAAYANPHVGAAQRVLCQRLLEAVGDVVWVDDEGQMDAVTAVSGSGPAYVFLLIECLTEAAIAEGLPPEVAEKLARATVIGSGALARAAPEPAAQLRKNVTSPGGTTEAALKVLMAEDGMARLMRRAIRAATLRSRELAG
jgi:pyrroline-5-carboxylate reductase